MSREFWKQIQDFLSHHISGALHSRESSRAFGHFEPKTQWSNWIKPFLLNFRVSRFGGRRSLNFCFLLLRLYELYFFLWGTLAFSGANLQNEFRGFVLGLLYQDLCWLLLESESQELVWGLVVDLWERSSQWTQVWSWLANDHWCKAPNLPLISQVYIHKITK